jgi:hypothetical protein
MISEIFLTDKELECMENISGGAGRYYGGHHGHHGGYHGRPWGYS